MPIAPIDSAGTHFYYEDTGAPGAAGDYTTFVLLHGLGFNLNIFRKLFPYAKDYGIRMIAFNARDYNGSTPYSAAEIQELLKPEFQNGGEAVRKWTREIAAFLVYVSTALGIPPIKTSQGTTSGGLIFMSWSMGNIAPMAMLGDPEAVNEETRLHLGKYLRKIFMLDPPSNVLGIPATGLYDPLEDASLSHEERLQVFPIWVSKHHSSITDLASVSVETLGARTILSDRGQLTDMMSPAELEAVNNASAVPNAFVIPGIPTKILRANVERSILNADLFPDVEVLVLWADQSIWHCLWGPKAIYDMVQPSTEGKKKRRVAFQRVPECSHFPHWERPEELVKIIAANA